MRFDRSGWVVLSVCVSLAGFPWAAWSQAQTFLVSGTYSDPENEVTIDLFMEPLSKFLTIRDTAADPLSASDPARIRADAANVDLASAEWKTFDLGTRLVLPPTTAGSWSTEIDVSPFGDTGQLLADIGYIILAVYTDGVARTTGEIEDATTSYYGTHSPGVFVFDTDTAKPTPTFTSTPTPTGTPAPTATPLPFGLTVEAIVDPFTGVSPDAGLAASDQVDLAWQSAMVDSPEGKLRLYFDRNDSLTAQYEGSGGTLVTETIVAGASRILPIGATITNDGVLDVDYGPIDLATDARFSGGFIPTETDPEGLFRWQYSDVPVGTYYIYGVLDAPGQGVVVDYSSFRVTIAENPQWPVHVGGGSQDRFVHGVAVDDVVPSATELDVVAVSQSGLLRVFDHLGHSWEPFEIDLNVTIDTAPVTADIDADGELEIILGTNQVTSDRNPVFAVRNALVVVDSRFKARYDHLLSLLSTKGTGNMSLEDAVAAAGLTGSLYFLPEGHGVYSTPSIADTDGNGVPEVVYTSRPLDSAGDSFVEAVEFDRDPNQPPRVVSAVSVCGVGTLGTPAVGNVDEDPRPEVVVGSRDGKIYAFELGADTSAKRVSRDEPAEKTLYGDDNRVDYYQAGPELQGLADSVALVVDASDLVRSVDGRFQLDVSRTLETRLGVCPDVRFATTQPSVPGCTAFLVAPDIMATAAGCISDSTFDRTRFVFGYRLENATTIVTSVTAADVYSASEVFARSPAGEEPGWVLVRLDRPVGGRMPLDFRLSGKLPDDARLGVIGYPDGLPVKISDGGRLRDNSPCPFFLASLDTSNVGSPGSPVINLDTLEVEGIFVEGEQDYQLDTQKGCRVPVRCPDASGCKSEKAVRTTEWARDVTGGVGERIFEITDPSLTEPSALRAPVLVDVDPGDGKGIQEILFAVSERDRDLPGRAQLYLIRGDGTPVFSKARIYESTRDFSSLSTPAVGRLETNPSSPLVALFTTRNELVAVNLQTGAPLFSKDFGNDAQAFASSSPAIGQAQPQPGGVPESYEIFIGGGAGQQGNLFGWYYDPSAGGLVPVEGIGSHEEPTASGAVQPAAILGAVEIADLDGDGRTEVVYTNEAGFVDLYEMPVMADPAGGVLVPADFPWPSFKHDKLRTGSISTNTVPVRPYREGDVNRDGVIDENDLFTIAKQWSRREIFEARSKGSGPGVGADVSMRKPQAFLMKVLAGMRSQ